MDVRFKKPKLLRLEHDENYTAGFGQPVVKAYRKRMQYIRSAKDERDFYKMKSLRYKKMEGDRKHQHSMRLNDQWRLILELEKQSDGKLVVIVDIEDYH